MRGITTFLPVLTALPSDSRGRQGCAAPVARRWSRHAVAFAPVGSPGKRYDAIPRHQRQIALQAGAAGPGQPARVRRSASSGRSAAHRSRDKAGSRFPSAGSQGAMPWSQSRSIAPRPAGRRGDRRCTAVHRGLPPLRHPPSPLPLENSQLIASQDRSLAHANVTSVTTIQPASSRNRPAVASLTLAV